MTPEEYRDANTAGSRTAADPVLSGQQSKLALYGLGLPGEAGEVADEIKKHLFHGKDLDTPHILKECGDVLWYLDRLLKALDHTMEDAMVANRKKLDARYPQGFVTGGGNREGDGA